MALLSNCCSVRKPETKPLVPEIRSEGLFDPNYKCRSCMRPFMSDSQVVEFQDMVFHQKCYLCVVCDLNLSTPDANPVYFKEKLWCEPHYMEYLLKLKKQGRPTLYCVGCSETIVDPDDTDLYRRALNHDWHAGCLVCNKCKKDLFGERIYTISGKYEEGEALWCKPCFLKYNTSNCANCGKLLTGKICKIGKKGYHAECFKCKDCEKPLQLQYFIHNKAVYCKPCYDKRFGIHCGDCSELVEGKYEVAFGGKYHQACFVCHRCRKPLVTGKFDKDEETGWLLCDDDFKLLRVERETERIKEKERLPLAPNEALLWA